jgi:hypothetical protein
MSQPRTTPYRLRLTFYALLSFLFLLHVLFYFSALGNDAVDDAYISFRYAQNAIRGYGLVFNPNERVEGFTNFLWTALMLPLEGAHIDVGRASMLLGTLFAIGVIALTIRFADAVGVPRAVGWLAALLLTADGSFALWAVGGLETPLFAFLLLAGALSYLREQRAGLDTQHSSLVPFPYSGIFFALAAMTRPEGVLVFAITAAHQSAWRIFAERRLFVRRDIERIIAFSALFVPYWLGRWAYYHSFLPNSFHAKVNTTGPTAQIERGWNHLSQFMNVHLGWVIALPPFAAVILSLRRATSTIQSPEVNQETASQRTLAMTGGFWSSYFAGIIVPYIAYIVYVGGDWSVGRFFVPLLAPFYLLLSTGIVDLWSWGVGKLKFTVDLHRSWANILGIIASGLLAIVLYLASSWNGEYGIYIRGFDAGRATLARETMGRWLKANALPGTLIAVDAAGQVPYFAELPAVDMFGINDLHIGRLNVEKLGQGTPGHEKTDFTYVILRQPEYVVIYGELFDTIKEYERAPETWTKDETLRRFLTLYRRRLQ